jgi:hypothetical protein
MSAANSTENGPDFYNPVIGTESNPPSAGNTQNPEHAFAPVACTAKTLTVFANFVPFTSAGITYTGSNTITVTVQKNGVSQSMACAVTVPSGQTTAATCNSASTFSVAAGDRIQYAVTQTNGTPAATSPYDQFGVTFVCQ